MGIVLFFFFIAIEWTHKLIAYLASDKQYIFYGLSKELLLKFTTHQFFSNPGDIFILLSTIDSTEIENKSVIAHYSDINVTNFTSIHLNVFHTKINIIKKIGKK